MGREQNIRLLVVESDTDTAKSLRGILSAEGYALLETDTGRKALEMVASHCPDCILLDLELADMDGRRVIEQVRTWSRLPILALSDRDGDAERAAVLDLGADDFLPKPFGTLELPARIRAALRHTGCESESVALTGTYRVGELTIDYKKRRVCLGDRDAHLTPNEFRIVALLGRHPGQVLPYRDMLRELWGPYASRDNKILRVHMTNIRRKLEPDPDHPIYLFTETGVGYRIAEAEDLPAAPTDRT